MADSLSVDLSGFGLERVSFIGKGRFASVQLVQEIDTGQTFVAKCVKLGSLSEKDRALAHQEVFLLEALNHSLIVEYYDSFLLEGQDVLVILMEHCKGGDLRQAVAQKAQVGGHFSEEQVMIWFAQIALALQYIHGEKVLHRDLKCSNIFLTGEGSAIKLGDFGISRVFEGSADAAETLVGTPYYMSPEVCSNQSYSWKSDVWSLGCVLYELCTLKHAFNHSTLQGLIHAIKSGDYDPIPSSYSQEMNNLLRHLLSTSAYARPSIDEIITNPFVQAFVERQVLPAQPPIDQEARDRSKGIRRSSSGLQKTWSATVGTGGTSRPATAIPMPDLGPQDLSLIIASRIQHKLVEKQLSLSSASESFDEAGSGSLPADKVHSLLCQLELGLSLGERTILVASIRRDKGRIQISTLEAKLAEADASQKIRELWAWAQLVLNAPAARLAVTLEARDAQRTGTLPTAAFQAALKELAPEIPSEQMMALMLLSEKDEQGEIRYASCIDLFGKTSAFGEDTLFFTCASQDLKFAAGVHQAWGGTSAPNNPIQSHGSSSELLAESIGCEE